MPTQTPRATPSTFAGLFGVSLATLMLQILLTRIFSVTLWYHYAFMAVSIALFGLTVGALWVYLRPASFPAELVQRRLASSALGFAVAIVVCFLAHLYIPFLTGTGSIAPSARGGGWNTSFASTAAYLGLTFTVISIPFVFSGVAVCLALTRFPAQIGRLYGADLAGAALGCVLLLGVLRLTDAPTAVFAVATCAALAAWCFARAETRARSLATASLALALVLGIATAWLTHRVREGSPALRLLFVKGERNAAVLYEKWNSFSYFRVHGRPNVPVPPVGWGLSEVAPKEPIAQLGVAIDAIAGTVMTRFDGDVTPLGYLEYDVTNFVHHLRKDARVLVVGTGGGRDVLSALRFGQREVTGVEINGDLIDAVNGRFGRFTGFLDRDPRVRFVNDEARSFVARSPDRFDVIQISMIDTWAATAAGAFVLTENSLYTVEAWQGFLDKLAPDGVLSVSRWHTAAQPAETHRLAALASRSLRESGVSDPSRHIVLVTNRAPGSERAVAVATLLVSPAPFSQQDLARVRETAQALHFSVLVGPEGASDPVLERITGAADLDAVTAGQPLDISAPNDDRPFFFHMLRLRDALRGDRDPRVANSFNLRAVRVLGALLLIVIGLTAVFLALPLALRGSRLPSSAVPWLVYFAGIGLGFMFVEISQIQRLIVFLGHPTYGLSVLLFSLLLSSGIGSALVPRIESLAGARSAAWRLAILLAALVVFALLTPPLIEALRGEPTPVRIGAAVGILFPLGLSLGAAFPLGMSAASLRHADLVPWFWGVNGATSVCASVVAVAISLSFGISAAFLAGTLCYAASIAAFAVAVRRETT